MHPCPTDPTHVKNDAWADTRPTLLIADDNEPVCVALALQLGGEFNVVATAVDSSHAVALAGEHRPDIALIDVQMPGGGGRVVVPAIARCSPDTRIVMLSGDESRASVLELLDAGAIAYLRKGTPSSEIATALGRALRDDPRRAAPGGS